MRLHPYTLNDLNESNASIISQAHKDTDEKIQEFFGKLEETLKEGIALNQKELGRVLEEGEQEVDLSLNDNRNA